MNILSMKNIAIDYSTLYLLLIYFLCGYIKVGLTIFIIVIIHELGHVLTSLIFKYKIVSIRIYPFGGVTKLDKDINTSINKEIVLALSGVFMQVIIIPFIISNESFMKYNLSIMLFNLIPIIPLDGSIIVRYLLNKYLSFKNSYYLSIIISIISIIIYVGFNYKYNLNNYLIIGLFIYKLYESLKDFKYIYNRFLLERFLNNYKYKKISTREGKLDILKLEVYQYFKRGSKVYSEKEVLRELFDNY